MRLELVASELLAKITNIFVFYWSVWVSGIDVYTHENKIQMRWATSIEASTNRRILRYAEKYINEIWNRLDSVHSPAHWIWYLRFGIYPTGLGSSFFFASCLICYPVAYIELRQIVWCLCLCHSVYVNLYCTLLIFSRLVSFHFMCGAIRQLFESEHIEI